MVLVVMCRAIDDFALYFDVKQYVVGCCMITCDKTGRDT